MEHLISPIRGPSAALHDHRLRARGGSRPAGPSHRPLLLATFLAGVGHPGLTRRDLDAVGRAALPAFLVAPAVDLGHGHRSTLQRLFHEPVELFAALLLRLIGHRHLLTGYREIACVVGRGVKRRCQRTLRFSADSLPRLLTISYSIV